MLQLKASIFDKNQITERFSFPSPIIMMHILKNTIHGRLQKTCASVTHTTHCAVNTLASTAHSHEL